MAGKDAASIWGNGYMETGKEIRRVVRQLVFGDTLLPQEFTIGLADPQTEISVWLHGVGTPIDVTRRHSMACAAPLTICIAFEGKEKQVGWNHQNLTLRFCESMEYKRILGEIHLTPKEIISINNLQMVLFEVRKSTNYCLPRVRLWAHYLLYAFTQWRQENRSGITMSFLEKRSAMVMFVRPHPTSLGSVREDAGGNIFPMNIMGEVGHGNFAFALKNSRTAAHLVERT